MRVFSLVAGVVAILSAPAATAATRAPTGKWIVDFGESQCVASRNYGTAASPLLFGLKLPAAGNVVSLMILRPSNGGGRFPEQIDTEIQLDWSKVLRKSALALNVSETKQRLIRIILPLSEFVDLAKSRSAAFKIGGELNETFQFSQMPELVKALDECVVGLRQYWNMSEAEGPNPVLRERVSGNLQNIFSPGDFPAVAVRKGIEGAVAVALLIDEKGKVADCTVVSTSGAPALDAQSCYVITRRAKFKPAIGSDERPARDSYLQRINWRLAL